MTSVLERHLCPRYPIPYQQGNGSNGQTLQRKAHRGVYFMVLVKGLFIQLYLVPLEICLQNWSSSTLSQASHGLDNRSGGYRPQREEQADIPLNSNGSVALQKVVSRRQETVRGEKETKVTSGRIKNNVGSRNSLRRPSAYSQRCRRDPVEKPKYSEPQPYM
ncbi:hypothetical protein J6590_023364 [Homalodisca vitripennis]|nr:hypothetical protein J6590_023364 [Homalodisca vitripennis]